VLADGERGQVRASSNYCKKEDPLSRKKEGGGIFLEGERGERVHLGEERSEKRKMAYTVQYQASTGML
jgi:hypothetical protein